MHFSGFLISTMKYDAILHVLLVRMTEYKGHILQTVLESKELWLVIVAKRIVYFVVQLKINPIVSITFEEDLFDTSIKLISIHNNNKNKIVVPL